MNLTVKPLQILRTLKEIIKLHLVPSNLDPFVLIKSPISDETKPSDRNQNQNAFFPPWGQMRVRDLTRFSKLPCREFRCTERNQIRKSEEEIGGRRKETALRRRSDKPFHIFRWDRTPQNLGNLLPAEASCSSFDSSSSEHHEINLASFSSRCDLRGKSGWIMVRTVQREGRGNTTSNCFGPSISASFL